MIRDLLTNNKIIMNETMLLCAFRYALGRMTYVVKEVADHIAAQAVSSEGLSESARSVIVTEITSALVRNELGMEMDECIWLRLRDLLSGASSAETQAPEKDEMFDRAAAYARSLAGGPVVTSRMAVALNIISYGRASALMDQLEAHGIISPKDGAKPRKVL